jgi:hypothetical protein
MPIKGTKAQIVDQLILMFGFMVFLPLVFTRASRGTQIDRLQTVRLLRLSAKQQHHNHDDEQKADRASANPYGTTKNRRE